jgi:Family of unknown function (DUF6463)
VSPVRPFNTRVASRRALGAAMKRRIHQYAVELMFFCTAMHTIVGAALYRNEWMSMARRGLVATVHSSPANEAAFWFFVVSLFYLSIALSLRWIRSIGVRPPASLGVVLTSLAVVGLALAPSFGWPFIATAGVLVLRWAKE